MLVLHQWSALPHKYKVLIPGSNIPFGMPDVKALKVYSRQRFFGRSKSKEIVTHTDLQSASGDSLSI